MAQTEVRIPAADAFPLIGTHYAPDAQVPPLGICVIINAATGVKQQFYEAYARFLVGRGFDVITWDYRGIGKSRYPSWRKDRLTMQAWGEEDFKGVIDWVARHLPRHKMVCVGHSVGGQLPGLASNNHELKGILGIAAQSGFWGYWPVLQWPVMLFYWLVLVPLPTRLLGRFPGKLIGSEDLPKAAALNWARWCRSPHYISDGWFKPIREYFHAYRGRLRLYIISDDHRFGPAKAVRVLASYYKHAPVEIMHCGPEHLGVEKIGHFGFFQSNMPESAWAETADWLQSCVQNSGLQLMAD